MLDLKPSSNFTNILYPPHLAITSFIVFKVIDLTIGMRVTEEEETIGLDVSEHSASGYPDFTNVTKE